eukprot:11565320-Ditylum_brightwellii.AAC.1
MASRITAMRQLNMTLLQEMLAPITNFQKVACNDSVTALELLHSSMEKTQGCKDFHCDQVLWQKDKNITGNRQWLATKFKIAPPQEIMTQQWSK